MIEHYSKSNEEFKTLVEIVGDDLAIKILENLGGVTVYIPKLKTFAKEKRNKKIFDDYSAGLSCKKIALKYKLTEDSVRKIINAMK